MDEIDALVWCASDHACMLGNLPKDCTSNDIREHFKGEDFKKLYKEVAEKIKLLEQEKKCPKKAKVDPSQSSHEENWYNAARKMAEDIENDAENNTMLVEQQCSACYVDAKYVIGDTVVAFRQKQKLQVLKM